MTTILNEAAQQRSSNKRLGITLILGLIAVLVISVLLWVTHRPTLHPYYDLSDEYLQIPQTNFEFKTIKGWENNVMERRVWIKERLLGNSSPNFYIYPGVEFSHYTKPSDFANNLFTRLAASENYNNPKSYRVNDVDIYISRYKGPATAEGKVEVIVIALIIYDQEGAIFHGWGSSSEAEKAEKILISMLSSLRVRE